MDEVDLSVVKVPIGIPMIWSKVLVLSMSRVLV